MCHQKDPTFFRSLSPKDPHFYQLSPNDPLFFENFDIFDEMLRNFGPEKPLFLMHFTERPPIFVRFVTERPPFLPQFVTERPSWGAWWHSYVTFICECPPPGYIIQYIGMTLKNKKNFQKCVKLYIKLKLMTWPRQLWKPHNDKCFR